MFGGRRGWTGGALILCCKGIFSQKLVLKWRETGDTMFGYMLRYHSRSCSTHTCTLILSSKHHGSHTARQLQPQNRETIYRTHLPLYRPEIVKLWPQYAHYSLRTWFPGHLVRAGSQTHSMAASTSTSPLTNPYTNRYGWRHQIKPWVMDGYRVIAPDMLGYGGTDKPAASEEYSMRKLCDDLAALLDFVGVQKVVRH